MRKWISMNERRRLYTDIACGINAGVTTALVPSGETKKEDLNNPQWHPNYVFESLGELLELLMET